MILPNIVKKGKPNPSSLKKKPQRKISYYSPVQNGTNQQPKHKKRVEF